jgi:hypothetical protein
MKIQYTFNWFEENSKHFDKWWDSEQFDWTYGYLLSKYCIKHIDTWWDDRYFEKSPDELKLMSIK